MMSEQQGPVIRASEIGQHAFCARSWWLARVKGYPSAHLREMALGERAHRAHGRRVLRYYSMQRLALLLLFLAISLAALGIYTLVRGG
jgi:hypothetical protein